MTSAAVCCRYAVGLLKLVGRNFWKLVWLNILFWGFCLLVVTIGPAVTAMSGVARRYVNGEPVAVTSDFWDGMLANFAGSTLCGGLYGAALFAMLYAARSLLDTARVGHALLYLPFVLCAVLLTLIIFVGFYIFPLLLVPGLGLRGALRQAVLLAISGLRTNLRASLIVGGIAVLMWSLPFLGIIWYALIGFSFSALVVAAFCNPHGNRFGTPPACDGKGEARNSDQ